MKTHCFIERSAFVSLILVLLAGCAASWAIEPGGIRTKFGKYAFTINAYPLIGSGAAYGGLDSRPRMNIGAAYPVDNRGYLLTLTSVVRDADRIEVIDNDGSRYAATISGQDNAGGISVLKIDRNAPLSSARIRPASTVRAGTRVVFLGMPLGGSLAAIPGRVERLYGHDGALIVTVSGEPGMSGTPVFDENGLAVGLLAYHIEHAPKRGVPGKSYLVLPMEYAAAAARSIINRVEEKSGWLGVAASVGDLTVEDVVPGSPAEKCGLCPGDRITGFNGVPVRTSGDLLRETGETRAGDTVRLTVIRDNETITLTPRLEQHPFEGHR